MKQTLERLLRGEDLSEQQACDLLLELVREPVPDAMAGALLAGLRAKGETAAELRGLARAMRELARRPQIPNGVGAVDIVGTGGDGSGSLNLSTGSALLAAAAGARVVKHGNRSVSSCCGSADVLEALGLALPLDEKDAGRCFERTGFTFLFAPYYHPALAAFANVRRSLGVRTVFNLLGPLTNPAAPECGVIGVYAAEAAAIVAETLSGMPMRRTFVVHGACGWDEPTPLGPFLLFDVRPGRIERGERDPARFGIPRCVPADLAGSDAAENARRLRAAFEGEPSAHRDALVLGAALALEVSGAVSGFEEGLVTSAAAIERGAALRLLDALRSFSRG